MKKIFILFIILLICSCSKPSETDFFAMNTYMKLSIYADDEQCGEIKKLIYDKDNKLKKDKLDINDNEVSELIELSCRISEFTDGAFDITLSPISDLWGFWNGNFRVPEDFEIKEKLKNTGYKNIQIENSVSVPDGFSIDLGGIAKGYTGDCISSYMKENNIKSGVVTLGGNVHTKGLKPDGSKWTIGIRDPFGEKNYYGTVSVENSAVVTSGGYERYFEENGKKYEHIINPETGYPAETDIASVTVICEKGAVADALSTAFYVMGSEKTKELCKKSQCKFEDNTFSVILIMNDGSVLEFGEIGLNG